MITRPPWQYLVAMVACLGVGTLMIVLGLGDASVWIGAVAFAVALNSAAWWGNRRQRT